MRLGRLTRASRRRADVDSVLAAYSAWRCECAAVRAAYRRWASAAMRDACFAAFRVALDREERAAARYARLLSRSRRLSELDVARQLAQLPGPFGAM